MTSSALAQHRQKLRAVSAWMLGALASFIVAAISIRDLSGQLTPFEINICRTGGGLAIICCAVIANMDLQARISFRQLRLQLVRNVVHACGGLLWTISIGLLPLATVFSLEFTAPAWAALLSFLVLGERTDSKVVLGLGVSLLGSLIILKPSAGSFNALALLPLGAAACLGTSALLTRRLTRSHTVFSILFWMMLIQLAMNLAAALATQQNSALLNGLSARVMMAAAALALSGLLSQVCLSTALRIGEANLVMPMDFARVPLIACIGYVFYQEPVDVWLLVGAILIFLGVSVSVAKTRA